MFAGIPGSRLIRWPQRFHKRDECGDFRGTQILAIGRHVPAALDDLPDKLIGRETRGDGIQRRTAQTTFAAKRVTIPALLALEQNRPL
jgi:hypothetical protein